MRRGYPVFEFHQASSRVRDLHISSHQLVGSYLPPQGPRFLPDTLDALQMLSRCPDSLQMLEHIPKPRHFMIPKSYLCSSPREFMAQVHEEPRFQFDAR